MRKSYYLLVLLLAFGVMQAQNSYTLTAIPFNPDPYNAGTNTGINADDVWGPTVTLPFSFCFYDTAFTKLTIGSNGIVSFDTAAAGSYCPWPISAAIPTSTLPMHSIMAPFQDINPGLGGGVYYDVRGVAPYRRFIISYFEVPMFSCTNMLFSEQIILYETTNVIETHILNKPLCAAWNNGNAVHGLNFDGTVGFAVPGRNYPTQWTAVNDGYRFTPVGTCAGPAPADSVSGKAYADYNNNCTQDVGEFPRANQAILANGGQYYGWTDNNGQYGIGMAAGSYVVNEMSAAPFYANACVPGGAYNVTLAGNVLTGLDFPDSASVICSDLSVGIGSPGLRRCRDNQIYVTYCNNGTYPDSSVVVTVTLNDSISLDSASMAFTSLGGNQYSFSVGDLMIGQCGNIILYCGVGCDTAGTVYCVSADISGTYGTECDTLNNSNTDCQALLAPLDPNAKYVAAQAFNTRGYVQMDDIDNDDVLEYMIHFQNVGTSYAQDVEVRDVIDASLDPSTLQPGAASAPYNWFVNGNQLLVRFENIMLADSNTNEPASHGFVKFRIQQRPGNPVGTVIHNQAGIYFDFEAPVITNQTVNQIPLASSVNPSLQDVAQIFPNPGKDQLIVTRNVDMEMTFVLYDIAGKELRRVPVSGLRTTVATADLGQGVYLYRIESDGKLLEAGKWMKQ